MKVGPPLPLLRALRALVVFTSFISLAHAQFTWSSGSFTAAVGSNTLASGATLNITGAVGHDFNGLALINNGTVNLSQGSLNASGGATFTNNATFNDTSTGAFGGTGAGGADLTFTNAATGIYNVSVSKNSNVVFTNAGTFNLTVGTYQFTAGGSSSGTINVSSGATLRFANNFSVPDATKLVGPGLFELSGGTLTLAGTLSVPTFNQVGGTLTGTQVLPSGTTFNWSGGNWSNSGSDSTTIASGATLNVTSAVGHDFNGRALINNGTVNLSQGSLNASGGATFTNNATFNDTSTGAFGGTGAGGADLTFTNAATGIYNVSVSKNSNVVFTNAGTFNLTAGTYQFTAGGSSSGTLNASSGTTVNFTNNYTLANGTSLLGLGAYQLLSGTLTASGAVTLTNFALSAGTLAGTHTINGSTTWTGTNLNTAGTTTVGTAGVLTISGTGDHDFDGRALVNNGTVNWTAGTLRSGNSGTITNHAAWNDAVIGYQFNNPFGGTALVFTNSATGTYTKSATGTTTFAVPFNNHGTLTVSAGTLNLNGGGSFSGAATAASGAAVNFSSNYAFANGTSLLGLGAYQLLSGTLTATDTINVNNFTLSGGALAGSHTFTGAATWTGTNLGNPGTTTIGATGNLTISGTGDHDLDGRALVNNGTVTWTAGHLRSGNSGTITNNAAWNDAATGYQFNNPFGGTSLIFTNASTGTYTKSATGTTTFHVPLINQGTLAVNAGTLSLAGGGSFGTTGTVTAASGAAINFTGNFTIADASKLTGPGSYQLLAGSLDLTGVLGAPGFSLQAGFLTNSQTFNNTVTWTSTSLNTAGTTTIGSAGVFTISGAGDHDFDGRALVNNGTVTWTAGHLRSGNSGTITNNAAWNDAATGYQFNNPFGGTSLVFTNSATGTYTKSVAGTTTFQVPFNNHGTLTVSAGTLNLNGGGSFSGSATAASGTAVNFSSNYAFANGTSLLGLGAYQLISGTLTASGTINVNNFTLVGGALAGSHTFTGAATWTGTNLGSPGTTTIGATGNLNISSAGDHDLDGRALVNNGTVTWTAGHLRSGNSGTITNNAAWNDAATGYQYNNPFGGTALVFTNSASGTYTKSASGTTTFQVPFVNLGAVVINVGTLKLNGGGSFGTTGTVTAASGAAVSFDNNFTIADASKLAGPGSFQLVAGSLDLSGVLGASGLTLQAGTLTNSHTFNNTVTWVGTNLSSAGTTTVGTAGVLTISGAGDHDFDGRALVNNGTVTWAAGHLRSGNSGTITNNAAWNDAATGYQFNNPFGGTSLVFTNSASGTYTKSVAGTTTFQVPFNNHGTLTVSAGTLNLNGGGSFSGSATAASGTAVNFSSNYAFANGTSLLGLGAYQLISGTLTASGTINVNNFTLVGGALAGSHTFTGAATWTGTNLGSPGTTTIGATGNLNISSAGDHDLDGRALVNNGTVTWTAGHLRSGNSGTITNNAAWNDAATGYQYNNPFGGTALVFTNSASGTYTKTGAGTTTFHVPFTNSGNIVVQAGTLAFASSFTNSGGSINTAGGNVTFANALDLGTGTLGGSGTITAPSVTAGGIVAPGNSPGALTITGDLTLLATATSRFEIGGLNAGTQYDTLNVSGTTTLNGTLELKFVNSFGASVQGTDTFTLLNAATLTGTFANVTTTGFRLATTDGLGSFAVNFSGTALTISNFVPVPEPSTWALLLTGLSLIVVLARRRH